MVLKGVDRRWPLIKKVRKLQIDTFEEGINFLMDLTYFKFDNKYYKQIFGTPMGSSISPIIADIVMQDLEGEVIKNLDFTVRLYYRYVDDTIIFLPKDKINNIAEEFKSYHERLKFTFSFHMSISFGPLQFLLCTRTFRPR